MHRKRKAIWGGLAALALAAVATGIWLFLSAEGRSADSGDSGEGREESRSVPVEIAKATAGRAEETFRTVGEIRAEERVELGAERSGRIQEIAVEDGARVEAGEVVLRFDDAAERAALESAQVAVEESEAALGRARTLSEDGFIAEATLEERAAAAQSARARLAEAREALEDTTVRAPLDGEVGILRVSPGDYVTAGQELVELVTTQRLRAHFSLPVEVAAALAPGDTVRLFLSEEREPLLAAVDVIAPSADPESRLVEVETVIAEAVAGMPPGAVVEVEVVTAVREDAVFVPETALQWQGPQAHLYRVEAGVARRVGVEPGVRRNGRVELRGAAVEPGQAIVVEGVQKVRDGAAVEAADDAGGGGEGGTR